MTLLVLVALPEPHFELQELHELQEDTWQSITGGNENVMEVTEHGNFIQIQIQTNINVCFPFKITHYLHPSTSILFYGLCV